VESGLRGHAAQENSCSKLLNHEGTQVNNKFSLHENYNDEETTEAGSDRSFGFTVGGILMVIGTIKAFVAGAVVPIASLIFVAGAVLLFFGFVAPSRLSALNILWSRIGAATARPLNAIVITLLFFVFVTPVAFVMRLVGQRPLGLTADRTIATYWIRRDLPAGEAANMRRQF
jgi:hypothetical protein